jgi:hypothetical protein
VNAHLGAENMAFGVSLGEIKSKLSDRIKYRSTVPSFMKSGPVIWAVTGGRT